MAHLMELDQPRSWTSQEWQGPWMECHAMVTLCGWHRAAGQRKNGRILNTTEPFIVCENKAHEVRSVETEKWD